MQEENRTPDSGPETGSVTMPAKEESDKEGRAVLQNVTLATVPDYVWKRIAKPSFFTRHPILAVLLLLFVLGLAFGLGKGAGSGAGPDMVADEPSLALVAIKGPILDVTKELEWVDKIALEDNIRGVVLRVDSPGGGAAASQELYSALKGSQNRSPSWFPWAALPLPAGSW